MKLRILAFFALLGLIAGSISADELPRAPRRPVVVLDAVDEKPAGKEHPKDKLPLRDLDDRIFATLRTIINLGADYANEDHDIAACYRVYEGALMMTAPMLEHRPELKEKVEKDLKAARVAASVEDRAFKVREIIDLVRKTLKDKPIDEKETVPLRDIDERIYNHYPAIINGGVELVKADPPDVSGCYHLYEGALIMTVPMQKHRPEWEERIDKSLRLLAALQAAEDRAVKARDVIREFRKMLKLELDRSLSKDTLWGRLHGESGVEAIVKELFFGAQQDKSVNLDRGGKFKFDEKSALALERAMVAWISSQSGGTISYSGKEMKSVHAEMKITADEFDAMMKHLDLAMERLKVPEEPARELRGIFLRTRKDIILPKKTIPAEERLWHRLGGEKAIRPMVHELLEAVIADPKVDFSRGGKFKLDAAGKEHVENMLVQYFSHLAGGPLEYTGRDLKRVHAGMGITEEQLAAMGKHVAETLATHKVADKLVQEVMALLAERSGDVVDPPKKMD